MVERVASVRLLTWLLATTALVTALVEALNWWLAEDAGYGLFIRTGWALLRSLGFLILIRQVRRGRAGAAPFALILSVTTVFALGRLIVPREGYPHPAGVAGFAAVVALCTAVSFLLYRSPITGQRKPAQGWLLAARVAAFSFSPLMLVACLVAFGRVFEGRWEALPAVVLWFVAGITTSYVVLFATFFLMRGKGWARPLLIAMTLLVLLIQLPLCWWLLGADGLIRDGGPVVVAALLVVRGLRRSG